MRDYTTNKDVLSAKAVIDALPEVLTIGTEYDNEERKKLHKLMVTIIATAIGGSGAKAIAEFHVYRTLYTNGSNHFKYNDPKSFLHPKSYTLPKHYLTSQIDLIVEYYGQKPLWRQLHTNGKTNGIANGNGTNHGLANGTLHPRFTPFTYIQKQLKL